MIPYMLVSENSVNRIWQLTSDNQLDNGGDMHLSHSESFDDNRPNVTIGSFATS